MPKPIICLHGIRRRDKWYKKLKKYIDTDKYSIEVFEDKYWPLFILFFHEKKLKKFQEFYKEILEKYNNQIPHLVCHSFGTYIFYKSIKKYPEIKFDRVIMVGSILNPEIEWNIFFKNKQIKKIKHEYGKKDGWVKFSKFIDPDAGNSGEIGFSNIPKKRKVKFIQVSLEEFEHSDYFYDLHIKNSWVPFLTDQEL